MARVPWNLRHLRTGEGEMVPKLTDVGTYLTRVCPTACGEVVDNIHCARSIERTTCEACLAVGER